MTERAGTATVDDEAEVPLERVEAELCSLAGQIAAATCRFLVLLGDFDAREGWAGWNIRSCAQWLSWRCGLDLRTAREQVRVARALRDLPETREAFAQGRLSYSKVRAISRVATPRSEPDLVEAALHAPAAQIERLTRGLETVERLADSDAAAARGERPEPELTFRWWWDVDGTLVVHGRLSAEDGAGLLAALARAEELRARPGSAEPSPGGEEYADSSDAGSAEPSVRDAACVQEADAGSAEPSVEDAGPAREEGGGSAEPWRRGDVNPRPPGEAVHALVAMAALTREVVDAPVHAPVADVIVHVDAATLVDVGLGVAQQKAKPAGAPVSAAAGSLAEGGSTVSDPATVESGPGGTAPGGPRLDDGPLVTRALAARLACDGRIRLSVDGSDGRTLDLGRRRRRPTAAQKTALWQRDRGCAVPGCDRARFLHAHHVRPWALGGPTSVDNLLLLCGEHHRALHDGGFSVVALGRQRFRFHGPGGATYPQAPAVRGSADEVVAAHSQVEPGDIVPSWDGFPLNLHYAVSVYLDRWEELARRDAGEPAELAEPAAPAGPHERRESAA